MKRAHHRAEGRFLDAKGRRGYAAPQHAACHSRNLSSRPDRPNRRRSLLSSIGPARVRHIRHKDMLPISLGANATTFRLQPRRFAGRIVAELSDERPCSITICPAEWARPPVPDGRIMVGPEGSDGRGRGGRGGQRGAERRAASCPATAVSPETAFGDGHGCDQTPDRRLFGLLPGARAPCQPGCGSPDR